MFEGYKFQDTCNMKEKSNSKQNNVKFQIQAAPYHVWSPPLSEDPPQIPQLRS